jgi:hypothetical protein
VPAPLRVSGPAARLALVAVVALTGCAKDLDLPPQKTAPVVTSLVPTQAWAGQLLRLEGARLDADPTANVVSFAGGTARGLRYEGSTLVVRVPDDAGTGPVIVTNGQGTSDPYGAFEYLGLGEPRRRAVVTRRSILHRPLAVHALGGDVILHSALYGGLVAAGSKTFGTAPELAGRQLELTAAAPWDGSLYATWLDTSRQTHLLRLDAGGIVTGEVVLPLTFAPSELVAMRGVDVVVVFGDVDPGTGAVPSLAAWSLDLATEKLAPTPLGLDFFFGAADVGNGKAAVVHLDGSFAFALSLVDVQAAIGGGSLAPAPVPGAAQNLAFDSSSHVPVAVAGTAGPSPRAALALDTGDLAVADLGPSPTFIGTVETFSTSTIEALAGAANQQVVLATRPSDGLSIGVALDPRFSVLWSVPGDRPTAASASGDVAFVAHGDANDVSAVNLVTGSRVARISFDVQPGGSGTAYGGTTAFLPRTAPPSSAEDELFFPASAFPALVRFPLGELDASVATRAATIELVAASAATAAVWSASDPGSVEAFVARGWTSPVTQPLPGSPRLAAACGPWLAVGYGPASAFSPGPRGLELLLGSDLHANMGIAGATEFHGLGCLPGDAIWTAVSLADGVHVQVWDPTTAATVQDAAVDVRAVRGAVLLEDGLWLISGDGAGTAVLLAPDLSVARTVQLAAPIGAVHAVSPNGRLLVERAIGGTPGETILRVFRADPDAGFPQIDQIVVEGNVEGLAFDGTGERLWLITRSPDGVVLVD